MSDDEIEKTYRFKEGSVTTHADGSVTGGTKGVKFETDGDTIRIKMSTLRRVGIENLVDVTSHMIKRDDTATSHHIVFNDGSEAKFSYSNTGKLLELQSSSLATMTDDGVVMFAKRRNG